MNTTRNTIAAVLLAVGAHVHLLAVPAAEAAEPEHARLAAARKAAHELPEVAGAEQQAKADRALTNMAYAEYKAARNRSNDSESAYRKAFDAALAKVDAGAPALLEKERAAFRERMLKARSAKKAAAPKAAEKDDEDDEPEVVEKTDE